MQLGIENIFGDLPDYPPSSDDSFCSNCSECLRQNTKIHTKSNSLKTGKSNISKYNENHKIRHQKLCQTNLQNFSTNPTSEIIKAVSSARNLKHLKVPQRYEYYQLTKSRPSDQIIDRNLKKLQFQLRKQNIDEKYDGIIRQKSKNLSLKNQKKKQVGNKKKQIDLKQQQRQMQKSAFMILRDQKVQYLKDIQTKIFRLQKQKYIEGKRNFKQELRENEKDANKHLVALQTTNYNQVRELKQKLQELKYIKRVNKVDQKKVLHSLEQQLKNDQQRLNENFRSEISNHIERSKLSKNR